MCRAFCRLVQQSNTFLPPSLYSLRFATMAFPGCWPAYANHRRCGCGRFYASPALGCMRSTLFVARVVPAIFCCVSGPKVVSLEKRQAGSTSTLGSADMAVDDPDSESDANAESRRIRPRERTRQGWEWTVGTMRREHTHDVKALAIHDQSLDESEESRGAGAARKGPVLVSAGVDASLALYSVPRFKTQASRFCKHV